MVKGTIVLFTISAAYILGDFCTYQLLGLNLYNSRGFTYIGDLSFTLLVLWVSYYAFRNAFFPSRHRLKTSKDPQRLLTKIETLFDEEKIFMDDELDRRKLGYYLKIRSNYLKRIVPHSFRNLVNARRIKAAKKRLTNPRYQNYSMESIGLEVGFRNEVSFRRAFKQFEGMTLSEFKKL